MSRAIQAFLNGQLVAGMVVAVVVSTVLGPVVARRLRVVRPAAFLAVLTTMAIVSLTIFNRAEGWPRFDLGQALTWWTSQRSSIIDVALTEPAWLLNVALFVPAGFIWTAVIKRPARVALSLFVFSFGIESFQGLTGFGATDVTDLAANTLGGIIGSVAVAVVWRIAPRVIPDLEETTSPSGEARVGVKWALGSIAGSALAIGACVLAVQAVVVSRQTSLRDEIEEVFAGMTIQDVNEIRDPDAAGLSPFFMLVSGTPDSYRFYGDTRPVEVRYPVDFLGAYRCVFVTFSASPPEFANGSGKACTEERYD